MRRARRALRWAGRFAVSGHGSPTLLFLLCLIPTYLQHVLDTTPVDLRVAGWLW